MPEKTRGTLVLGLFCLALAAPPAPSSPNSRNLAALERQLLDLINRDRAAHGVRPLQWHEALAGVARAHSADMRARRFFAHLTPEGRSPLDRVRAAGIAFTRVGENLAWARDITSPHAMMMAEPVGQPNHRTTLLHPHYTHAGIGIVEDGPWLFITEDFIAAGTGESMEWDGPGRIAAGVRGITAAVDVLSKRLAEMHARLGQIALATGNLKEAQEAFRNALQQDPHCAAAHLGLGQVLEREGDTEAARNAYAAAVAANPDEGEARFRLAELLLAAGQTSEAAIHYGAVTQLQPHNAAAWFGAAACKADAQPEEATRLLRRACALDPALVEKARAHPKLRLLVPEP